MRPVLHDRSFFEDDNLLGVLDRRNPVRNQNGCPVFHDRSQFLENALFGIRVHIG